MSGSVDANILDFSSIQKVRKGPSRVSTAPIPFNLNVDGTRPRTPTELLRFPIPSNVKQARHPDWRAGGTLEGSFSPVFFNQGNSNRRNRSAQFINFGANEDTFINLVEPIGVISTHHVTIDPETKESTIVYRVFFHSDTVGSIDSFVKDIGLLKKKSTSQAKYTHGQELIEITTLNVWIGEGLICVERVSEFKTDIGPVRYNFTDCRLKYDVCRAAISKNGIISRKYEEISVRSDYHSLKNDDKPFEMKESIELIFGRHDESVSLDEANLITIDHDKDPVYTFQERINAYGDKKLTIERNSQVVFSERLAKVYKRGFVYESQPTQLESDNVEDMDNSAVISNLPTNRNGAPTRQSFRNERKSTETKDRSRSSTKSSAESRGRAKLQELSINDNILFTGFSRTSPSPIRTVADPGKYNSFASALSPKRRSTPNNLPEESDLMSTAQGMAILPRSVNLSLDKSFDLTKDHSKRIFTHNRQLHLGALLDEHKLGINLNLIIRTNRSKLDFKPIEFSVDNVTIWKKPKADRDQKD